MPFLFALAIYILLAVCAFVPQAAHSPTVVIENDMGGVIDEYNAKFADLNKRHARVIIKGECMSACTRFMRLHNVCATRNATFGFHGVYDPDTDELLADISFQDSKDTDLPKAFALERKYDAFHMSLTKKRPYTSKRVEPGVRIVYFPVISHHKFRYQEFLMVKATKIIKRCY